MLGHLGPWPFASDAVLPSPFHPSLGAKGTCTCGPKLERGSVGHGFPGGAKIGEGASILHATWVYPGRGRQRKWPLFNLARMEQKEGVGTGGKGSEGRWSAQVPGAMLLLTSGPLDILVTPPGTLFLPFLA